MSWTLARRWQIALGVIVSLLCLWLALRPVPLSLVGRTLSGADYTWLVPAIALQLLAVVARARRWNVLLMRQRGLATSFWAQGVGYLFTNLLPLRLGEPARVIVMSERSGLPLFQVAASAAVERLLDVLTILLALVLILPWMRVPAVVSRAAAFFAVLALVAFVLLLLAVRLSGGSEDLLRAICRRLPGLPVEALVARWRELVEGLRPLTHWLVAAEAALWSAATWTCSIAVYWCVLRAFRADATAMEAAFMVVALSLAVTVPSSPGFIGIFQWVGQQALVVPFGSRYDSAQALAITLTAHLTYYLLTTGLGVLALWQLGESLARIGKTVSGGRARVRTPESSP